jgi:hypothetical protein
MNKVTPTCLQAEGPRFEPVCSHIQRLTIVGRFCFCAILNLYCIYQKTGLLSCDPNRIDFAMMQIVEQYPIS